MMKTVITDGNDGLMAMTMAMYLDLPDCKKEWRCCGAKKEKMWGRGQATWYMSLNIIGRNTLVRESQGNIKVDLRLAKVRPGSLKLSGFHFVSDFLKLACLQTSEVLKFARLRTSDVSLFVSHQSPDPDCQGFSLMSSSNHSPAVIAINFNFSCTNRH